MHLDEFQSHAQPDPAWSPALIALWHQGRGDWTTAHDTLQDAVGADADWVHAHLHRVEGDAPNAAYWYRRARQPVPPPAQTHAAEWRQIATTLLGAR